MGSTKSNMGHPEPASGLAALAKVKRKCLVTCLGLGEIIKQASMNKYEFKKRKIMAIYFRQEASFRIWCLNTFLHSLNPDKMLYLFPPT